MNETIWHLFIISTSGDREILEHIKSSEDRESLLRLVPKGERYELYETEKLVQREEAKWNMGKKK